MRSFLEQYGTAIFTLVLMAILIAFAGPVGNIIKTNVNTQIQNVNEIRSERVKNVGRAEEPKNAVDQVYCILYDDGELTISQNEITPDENRTVLNKGYFTRPKDVDTTEGKQHIITVRFVGGVKPKNCQQWFGEYANILNSCSKLQTIKNIENLYTAECISMYHMFSSCKNLQSLNVSTVVVNKVQDLDYMFYDCNNLTQIIGIEKWNTENLFYINGMFQYCYSLTNLNVGNFHVNNVSTMHAIFMECHALTSLDISGWNISKVNNMSYMFCNCESLTTLNFSNFDIYKNTYIEKMFSGCKSLISITCPQSVKDKLTSDSSTNIPSTVTWTIV